MKLNASKEWFDSRVSGEIGKNIEVRPAKELRKSGFERRPCSASSECHYCRRPGILTCQYVIQNQWDEGKKAFVRKPWVFRNYYCRYHLAAQNHPKGLNMRLGGNRVVRLQFRPDHELIAEWESQQND